MKASKSYSSRYQRDRISQYLEKGALILDVRTDKEWLSGHIEGSQHIEFSTIASHALELKKLKRPIIAVCAGGVRSAEVVQYLEFIGIDIINGGSWQNVAELVSENALKNSL